MPKTNNRNIINIMPNILNLKEKNKVEKKQVKRTKPIKNVIKTHLKWTAPEFEYYNKNKQWFIITGVIAGILFLIAIFTKNFLFGLLIGMSYFLVMTYSTKEPKDIQISITPKGIMIENALYEFENLRSFWIFYNPPVIRELSLRSKKTIMPYIKISLGEENPVNIRRALIKYLPEKKHKESTIDNLARNLRF